MQRSSKDVPEGDSSSSSGESEPRGILPRTVSADDGALKKAALQVQKDLAGVAIPEVTSVAALNAAATAPIGNTPLAAGQDAPSIANPTAGEPSRLSPELLRALDAQTEAQPVRQSAVPASLAVQPADSRRGTNDSVAEPLPSSAYAKGRSSATGGRKDSVYEPLPQSAYAGKPQPSRFAASPRGPPDPAASDSEDSDSVASEDYPEAPLRAGGKAAPGRSTAAEAMGLTLAVKAASRMRTESDISQDTEGPTSARPLLAGTSSAALAAAPGSVHVSPKGSVVGFMPLPATHHPLHGDDDNMVDCCTSSSLWYLTLCCPIGACWCSPCTCERSCQPEAAVLAADMKQAFDCS